MKPLSHKEYEIIEGYLKGELPMEEAKQIEKRTKESPAFKKEVDWMRSMFSLGEYKKDKEILKIFDEIHQNKMSRYSWKKWAVAAVLLLASGIAWFFVKPILNPPKPVPFINSPRAVLPNNTLELDEEKEQTPKVEQLPKTKKTALPKASNKPAEPPAVAQADSPPLDWKKYMEHEEGLQMLGQGEDAALDSALTLLEKGMKKEALLYFEKYFSGLSSDDDDYEMRLLASSIYLEELEDLKNAKKQALIVKKSDAIPVFKAEADFYLAIIAWENGHRDGAKERWKVVADQEYEPWKSKAKAILETLEK